MKFYSAFLALCALNGAAAFAPKAFSKPSSPSVLHATDVKVVAGQAVPATSAFASAADRKEEWNMLPHVKIQGGGTLRTWKMPSFVERAQIFLETDGRPLTAKMEMWQGPNYTPQSLDIYIENGSTSPFRAIVKFPEGSNTVAIRNVAAAEFPLFGSVEADGQRSDLGAITGEISLDRKFSTHIQGGAIETWPIASNVKSAQVMFKNPGGRAMRAKVEVLQGPNNKKQEIVLFSSGGNQPFYGVFETPGTGYTIRVTNTGTVEFPFDARVEPYELEENIAPIVSEGSTW